MSEAIVWYTGNGQYYHMAFECGTMVNPSAHTLADALKARKKRCPYCHPVAPEMMDEPEAVWVNDETHLFHISAECEQLTEIWAAMPLLEALETGGSPCEECGAYHYVHKLAFQTPDIAVPTGEFEVTSDGNAVVYTGAQADFYHRTSTCQNQVGLKPARLSDAADAQLAPCPVCKPQAFERMP